MKEPFRKILVPLSFEENASAVLELASKLARTHDSTVYLLHVLPIMIVPPELSLYAEMYRPQHDAAEKHLRELAERNLDQAVAFQVITRVGEAANTILEIAAELGIDVMVLETHGRKGLARFFVGSCSRKHHSQGALPCNHHPARGERCDAGGSQHGSQSREGGPQ